VKEAATHAVGSEYLLCASLVSWTSWTERDTSAAGLAEIFTRARRTSRTWSATVYWFTPSTRRAVRCWPFRPTSIIDIQRWKRPPTGRKCTRVQDRISLCTRKYDT